MTKFFSLFYSKNCKQIQFLFFEKVFKLYDDVLALSCYSLSQSDLNYIGNNLHINFAVVNNSIATERFQARITLVNEGDSSITKVIQLYSQNTVQKYD